MELTHIKAARDADVPSDEEIEEVDAAHCRVCV